MQCRRGERLRLSKPRILSVSYDHSLLVTREEVLTRQGYDVVSAWGFQEVLQRCKEGGFDLFILGHSIPSQDKLAMIAAFRKNCSAPILSLRKAGEPLVDGADHHLDPEPLNLLSKVSEILPRGPAAS